MTVKELIEKLKEIPQDYTVYIYDEDALETDSVEITVLDMWKQVVIE